MRQPEIKHADMMPDSIDALLLRVGEDEHIASLFTNNAALLSTDPGSFGVEKCYMVAECPIYTGTK